MATGGSSVSSSWWWNPKAPKAKKFKILALDGGGVRAILQSTILQRLVLQYPTLCQDVDMFAGVSAGSIVAGALAVGMTPAQVSEIWGKEVGKIFVETWTHRVGNIDNAIGSCYSNQGLHDLLQGMVGSTALKDLKQKILVPAFDLNPSDTRKSNVSSDVQRWHPEFFHNLPNSANSESFLTDVILRSAAAPTYFPICDGFVDGGTFANNPSIAAVSAAVKSGIKLEDISVISISTGSNPTSLTKAQIGSGDWGLVEWGPKLIQLLLDGTTGSIDYECKCLLQGNYCRVDPILGTDIGLDDASAVPALIELAMKFDLTPIIEWIDNNWHLIKSLNPNSMDVVPPMQPIGPNAEISTGNCIIL